MDLLDLLEAFDRLDSAHLRDLEGAFVRGLT